MTDDPDLFRDGRLGFELRKPASWEFLPPAWGPLERAKRNLDADDWLKLAGKPFCCAFRNDQVAQARPTLQVTARPFSPLPRVQELPRILEAMIESSQRLNPSLEVEERIPHAIVSGHAAVGFRSRFELQPAFGKEQTAGHARARSFVVFARQLSFAIGLSSSDDPEFYDEAEFESILASIRIR